MVALPTSTGLCISIAHDLTASACATRCPMLCTVADDPDGRKARMARHALYNFSEGTQHMCTSYPFAQRVFGATTRSLFGAPSFPTPLFSPPFPPSCPDLRCSLGRVQYALIMECYCVEGLARGCGQPMIGAIRRGRPIYISWSPAQGRRGWRPKGGCLILCCASTHTNSRPLFLALHVSY